MANELDRTQPGPDGETVAENEEVVTNDELDTDDDDSGEDNEQEAEEGAEDEGSEENDEGDDESAGEEDATAEDDDKSKPKKKKLTWEMRRIHEETNKRRAMEQEAERLRKELERLRKGGSDDQDTSSDDDRSTDTVEQRARQIVQENEFKGRLNAWDQAGAKEFGREDFDEACNTVATLIETPDQRSFMETITDPDIVQNGHKLVMELAKNPEEAERLFRMPERKRTIALARMADKLSSDPAPKPKPISKVPPPVTPVGGKTQASSRLDDPNIDMDTFADKFLSDLASRRR